MQNVAVDAKTFLVPAKFQEVLVLQILGKVGLLILDFPYVSGIHPGEV